MKYVLEDKPTFRHKVTVVEPGDNQSGEYDKFELVVKYKRFDEEQFIEFTSPPKPVKEALVEVVVDWSGIADAQGNDIPFSIEKLNVLMKSPHAMWALWSAFVEGSSGVGRKN